MSAAEPLVSACALSKDYALRRRAFRGGEETLTAVKHVSFALSEGESVGIVGESGSGKTTLARMVAGLESPTSGEVSVCGKDRGYGRPRGRVRRSWGRDLQMVFQDPYSSLDPRQTVADAIAEVLKLHFQLDDGERRRRAGVILERVGLDRRQADQRPHALSGGERQRAAIARALAAEPSVMVLDEAASALDVSIQAQILNLLSDLREGGGIAYLFLSHDLAVVSNVTERVLVMQSGEVVEEGGTDTVLTAPSKSYTKRLLASVPRPGWKPSRGGSLD